VTSSTNDTLITATDSFMRKTLAPRLDEDNLAWAVFRDAP
jgi:hypothetical protein